MTWCRHDAGMMLALGGHGNIHIDEFHVDLMGFAVHTHRCVPIRLVREPWLAESQDVCMYVREPWLLQSRLSAQLAELEQHMANAKGEAYRQLSLV